MIEMKRRNSVILGPPFLAIVIVNLELRLEGLLGLIIDSDQIPFIEVITTSVACLL